MTTKEVLDGIPSYFANNVPQIAINLINGADCRVENFFVIHTGVYLHALLNNGDINGYEIQHHIPLPVGRVHVDIRIVDAENNIAFIEVKHFMIDNAPNGRNFRFYTRNSVEARRVGIIGDFVKLDNLRLLGVIQPTIKLYCCAFVTPNVIAVNHLNMVNRFLGYPEIVGWVLQPPAPHQSPILGFMYFEKQ